MLRQGREGRKAALAADLGGHALIELGRAAAVQQEGGVGMAMGVEKARRHHQPGCIQLPGGLFTGKIADGTDPAVLYGHIRPKSRLAGAVYDQSAANDDIVHEISLLKNLIVSLLYRKSPRFTIKKESTNALSFA